MTFAWRLLAACALALLPSARAALQVDLALESSRVALADGALEVAVVVSPPQPALKHVLLETLVDTTGAVLVSDMKVKGDGSKFVAKLSGDKKPQAGLYKLKVSATDKESKESAYEVLQLKVSTAVEVASAKANGRALAEGDTLTGQHFSSSAEDVLQMEVSLRQTHDKTPVAAHQAFLRFTHVADQTETYFVLTAERGVTHRASLQFAALSKKFGYHSGPHRVQLILGAPTFESAIVWDLGEVELRLGAAPPSPHSPLYAKPLLHESDTTLQALPEIQHVMREQDPRPALSVSLAFTAAVQAPLAFFLLFVARLGLNLGRLFQGSVLLFGCVFLASLAGILVLFGLYWLELTMFQTLGYLSVLGFVNLWSGHLTLKRLAQTPAQKATKLD